MAAHLPSGTVTFLLTDLEGSTRLWEQDPEPMRAAMIQFCSRCLDPLVGVGRFDFVHGLGAPMPMQVIGMLLGIPDDDLEAIRDRSNTNMRTEAGQPMKLSAKGIQQLGAAYADYAIDELVRFEPPAPHTARYVTRDVDYHGQTVPEGAVMMMLIASACRDDHQYPPDGDAFDIHREPRQHVGFGVGIHYCLGASLARLEGRIALEEILKRFPEWDIELENAVRSSTSTTWGWESMPSLTPS